MNMEWLTTTLHWYVYLLILGIIFFPITARLFRPFADKGYPFAKTIAMILLSYGALLVGILHIFPFSQEGLVIIVLVSIFCVYRFFGKEIREIRSMSRRQILLIVFEELMFLLCLIMLVYIRGQEPAIRGLEKFMDFGFMQSILKSQYFPPLDMWLSADATNPNGYAINYYYFGHLSGALLIKLSGISAFKGYNLILATIFAQGMTLTFSLTQGIVSAMIQKTKQYIPTLLSFVSGLVGAYIVNLSGNFHTIYLYTKGYPNESPVPFWGIFQSLKDITTTMQAEHLGFIGSMFRNSGYWYPNATRFIPYTIHEFPAYSYVVADLHGHVFDIPFVLLTLGILFMLFRHWTVKEKIMTTRYELIMSIIIGGVIAVNYMTNAFDGPIYLLLALLLFFLHYKISWEFVMQSAVLIGSFMVASLPYSLFFKPFSNGIGVNCSPDFLVDMEKLGPFLFEKNNCQLTPIWMFGVLWGFFLSVLILYLMYIYLTEYRHTKKFHIPPMHQFILMIFGFGLLLVTIPEFIYAKDIYPAHFRANTMFKLGYQSFMMMGVVSAVVFAQLIAWKSRARYVLVSIFAVITIQIGMYWFVSFPSFYPGFAAGQKPATPELDGSVWLQEFHPQDKEIIDYINKHIPQQLVILEAQGDSYTDYNRVSAYTGNPTVAGWWVHEWLWRGSSDVVGSRIPDIEALYQSEDIQLTKQLIDKYTIEYVVISEIEHEKYLELNEEKFKEIGVKVFESNNGLGALYKVY